MPGLSAFLNERSLTLADGIPEARRRMSTFLSLYSLLTARVVLRSEEDLSHLSLAADYPLSKWRNDNGVDRDERTYFRTIVNRSPALVDMPQQEDAWTSEARLDGTASPSCLSAYLTDGLLVSLDTDKRWHTEDLEISVTAFDEDGELVETSCTLPHASRAEHESRWREWISQRLRAVNSPEQLWTSRHGLYPKLSFCPSVEGDLKELSNDQLLQVKAKLDLIQRVASQWTEGNFPHGQLPKSSPESGPTLKQFSACRTFKDPEGDPVTFSWHLRFTPHAGRLYYHPTWKLEAVVMIGYIGPKLPTVSDPT